MTNSMLLMFLTHCPHLLKHDEALPCPAFEHTSTNLNESTCVTSTQFILLTDSELFLDFDFFISELFFEWLHIWCYISLGQQAAQCKACEKSFGVEEDHDDFLKCRSSSST